MNDEWMPRRSWFWCLFDTSNGDSLSRRYVWWFDTRKAAMEHKRHQEAMRHGASLSKVVRVFVSHRQR